MVFQQGTILDDDPHRHFWLTETKQGGHFPWWHVSIHKCFPQGRSFSHNSEQVGTLSMQLFLWFCSWVLPQGQDLTFLGDSSHSPHSPGWHILLHLWFWQESIFMHGFLHANTPFFHSISPWISISPQSIISSFSPQKHEAFIRTLHESHGPSWQTLSQLWRPHFRGFSQHSPHDSIDLWSEHLLVIVVLPHGQRWGGAIAEQGGQGPGWHWRVHVCGQLGVFFSFSSGFPHGPPHECGVI